MNAQLAYEQIKSIGTVDSMIITQTHHWTDGLCSKKWAITTFAGYKGTAYVEHESLETAVQIVGNKVRTHKAV